MQQTNRLSGRFQWLRDPAVMRRPLLLPNPRVFFKSREARIVVGALFSKHSQFRSQQAHCTVRHLLQQQALRGQILDQRATGPSLEEALWVPAVWQVTGASLEATTRLAYPSRKTLCIRLSIGVSNLAVEVLTLRVCC